MHPKKLRSYKLQTNQGFTLIELIVYLGIVSVFMTSAVYFSWDILFGQVKSEVAQEVQQNSRVALQRMTYEIRRAKAINSVGSGLSLSMADDTTTVFDVNVDGVLQINEDGGGAVALTSDKVQVTSLTFTDRSIGDSKNVKIELTISHVNPENVQEWKREESFETTVEVRGK